MSSAESVTMRLRPKVGLKRLADEMERMLELITDDDRIDIAIVRAGKFHKAIIKVGRKK
jgi:hypothetical protein